MPSNIIAPILGLYWPMAPGSPPYSMPMMSHLSPLPLMVFSASKTALYNYSKPLASSSALQRRS